MSVIESLIFPDALARGTVGGPGFSTTVVVTTGGREYRNQNWSRERARYDLAVPARTAQQREELTAFFRRVRGRAFAFRMRDWADYQLVDELLGTGDSVRTVFQLRKASVTPAGTEYRDITKPRPGTLSVTVNGTPAAFSVDTATGVVTMSAPPGPGALVRASCDFDVPVRFDRDELRWEWLGNDMYRPEALEAIEERVQ